jgi:hypothetical protein
VPIQAAGFAAWVGTTNSPDMNYCVPFIFVPHSSQLLAMSGNADETRKGATSAPLSTISTSSHTCVATDFRNAAHASSRVESSTGNGEFRLLITSGISVHPSTTASQPSSFMRRITS